MITPGQTLENPVTGESFEVVDGLAGVPGAQPSA